MNQEHRKSWFRSEWLGSPSFLRERLGRDALSEPEREALESLFAKLLVPGIDVGIEFDLGRGAALCDINVSIARTPGSHPSAAEVAAKLGPIVAAVGVGREAVADTTEAELASCERFDRFGPLAYWLVLDGYDPAHRPAHFSATYLDFSVPFGWELGHHLDARLKADLQDDVVRWLSARSPISEAQRLFVARLFEQLDADVLLQFIGRAHGRAGKAVKLYGPMRLTSVDRIWDLAWGPAARATREELSPLLDLYARFPQRQGMPRFGLSVDEDGTTALGFEFYPAPPGCSPVQRILAANELPKILSPLFPQTEAAQRRPRDLLAPLRAQLASPERQPCFYVKPYFRDGRYAGCKLYYELSTLTLPEVPCWEIAPPETGPTATSRPLSDYGGRLRSTGGYGVLRPETMEEAVSSLRGHLRAGGAVRTRGRGHSYNGQSLPREGELLFDTTGLRHIRPQAPDRIAVGAGITSVSVDLWLRSHGYAFEGVNAGGPASTLGGYIAAGGLPNAATRGLWNYVDELVLVDGTGEVHTLSQRDALFPWVFGSQGELGCVLEATLRIRPLDHAGGALPALPAIDEFYLSDYAPQQRDDHFAWGRYERRFWYTLFCVPADEAEVVARLQAIERTYSTPVPLLRNRYRLARGPIVAPLVFPFDEDGVGLATWGDLTTGQAAAEQRAAIERGVMAILREVPRARRYFQAESVEAVSSVFELLAPPERSRFEALKRQLDPHGQMNRGALHASV